MDYSKLLEALLKLMRPEDIPPAVIERQKFNVQDKMREIERVLQVEGGSIAFASFFTSENNRGEIIALFLALLELLRLKRIIVRQTVPFASIYVFLREDQSDVL
jgi:segregation and condensation protein A